MVYRETRHTLRLIDGRTVSGIAFTIDRTHRQYAPKLEFDELLRLIRQGVGVSGANPDYVTATHAHLVSLGLHDRTLSRLSRALEKV
jgi:cation transport protein ChaC